MKFLLLYFSLFVSLTCFSQPGDKMIKGRQLLANDSMINTVKQIKDSLAKTLQDVDSVHVQNNIDQNMDYILQLQKDQTAKKKKAAIIRIAIGVVFLIVLIIGLRRKTVRK